MWNILIDSDWLANSHAPPPIIEAAPPKGLPNLRRCQVWHKPFKASKAKQAWPIAQNSERLQSIPSKEFHVMRDGIAMSCVSSNVLQFNPLHLCMNHDKRLCSHITAASPGGSLIHWTCGLWCLTSPEWYRMIDVVHMVRTTSHSSSSFLHCSCSVQIRPKSLKGPKNVWIRRGTDSETGKALKIHFLKCRRIGKGHLKILENPSKNRKVSKSKPLSTQNGRVRIAEAGVSFHSKEWTSQVFFLRLSTSRLAAH